MNENPLIKTKFSVPQTSTEFVHRARLTDLINQGMKVPLTLLIAPAGFGKTILLVDWFNKSDLPVAWLNIDSDDNDITRFLRYLIGAIQTQKPQLGEDALDFFLSPNIDAIKVGMTLLINEISALTESLALVLDDFQNLENPAILFIMDFLMRHLPQNLHVIIASRSEPAFDLTPLRSKNRIVELNMKDLRFTKNEIVQFFKLSNDLSLTEEIAAALEKRTEGWITVLQMAAVSVRNQENPNTLLESLEGDAHYLVDFLAEEVLDHQPDDIRQFLLKSSILNTLTDSLCEAVVNPNAQPGYGMVMLNRLKHAGLFISAMDEKHKWFRYHNLFMDFLRHIHEDINPEEIPILHKRAALWFEKNGNLNEAFRHGLASGDIEWTADLIERNFQAIILSGEVFSLTHWIIKLPDTLIQRRLRLGLAYAWTLIANYQLDLGQYWIDEIQKTLDHNYSQTDKAASPDDSGDTKYLSDAEVQQVYGGLVICKSFLAMLKGDLAKATKFSNQATKLLEEDNPFVQSMIAWDESLYFILSGDPQKAIVSLRNTIQIARQANNLLILIIATCQLAEMQALQGQLNQALVTLEKARVLATGPDDKFLSSTGLVDMEYGKILLEHNKLPEADEYLERGCHIAESLWTISILEGLGAYAHLKQAQGDITRSLEIIEEAYHMALSTESSQWDDIIVSSNAARLALLRNDLAAADQWWIKCGFSNISKPIELEKYPYYLFEYLQLTQARFLYMRGQDLGSANDLRQSLVLLDTLLIEAKQLNRVKSQIEILVLQALVLAAQGDDRSKSQLMQALALAEPENFRRIFLDDGQRLVNLLEECLNEQQTSASYLPSQNFIKSLISEISSQGGSQDMAQPAAFHMETPAAAGTKEDPPCPLSDREMEVLRLIASGKSNKEIAGELYLALNTVKRHAYNIYRKLEVRKRTEAVSKARKLGFLP